MWNFFESFFIEIVITIIFSTTLFAFYVKKFRNRINEKALNLTKIYKEGKDIKKMKRAMQSASKIYSLAFVPYDFIVSNEQLLIKKLNEGCCIRFLFCNPDSTMIKEASEMENGKSLAIAKKIEGTLDYLKKIKREADKDATGTIEVRTYNTEIRNPVTICFDHDKGIKSFLTVLLPPKRSIQCLMIEYTNEECNDLVKYFNIIWERHSTEKDIILKL